MYVVIFICLTSLLLQIKALRKDHLLARKLLEALMWTLRQREIGNEKERVLEMEDMRESIEIAMGRARPKTGDRDDYLVIFGHEMRKFWTALGFNDSVPLFKRITEDVK